MSGPAESDVMEMFTQAFWDERYGSRSSVWSGEPNAQLVAQASGLPAGTALDVGCGEGADAIWLAARGWRVTALDVSPVALERGARRAADVDAEAAERIDWLQADLLAWDGPQRQSYDLVSCHFMQLPAQPREAVFRRLAAAVAPGGTLLIVGHHPSDQHTGLRPPRPELFYTASDVAASLDPDGWEIVVDAAPARSAADKEGNAVVVHDAVLRARRRSV